MKKRREGYEVIPFPIERQAIVDAGRLARRKHTIRCLLEVDVSNPRRIIREHKEKTGEPLSFTAFVIACAGRAVEKTKYVHGYRNWRNQVVIFDDVDVLTYIEIDLRGRRFPLAHIVRSADKRTWRDIHDEIRSIQAFPEKSPSAHRWKSVRWFLLLPGFVRHIFYRLISRNPHAWKRYVGTVYLTAVGMFGTGSGWGIGVSAHTLGIIVGSIRDKPVVVEGRIEIRECLNLTVDFDHDLVDGAPAARFIEQFTGLIENGYSLI